MPRMYRENVERVVKKEDVAKWQQSGYKLMDDQNEAEDVKTSKAEEKYVENVNIKPEANQEAGEGNDFPINPPDVADTTAEEQTAAQNTDYEAMNVQQLRKVAKDLGVQGYQNMNRATLLAVIAAH